MKKRKFKKIFEFKPNLLIKLVDNGILVVNLNEEENENFYVIEFNNVFDWSTNEEDAQKIIDFLYLILDCLSLYSSKYSRYRLSISLKHGENYICKEEKCNICKKNNLEE
ncbi:MAG: hypothetical protein QXL51_00100 [Candidatus Aenigmatarchaeota archaeon]